MQSQGMPVIKENGIAILTHPLTADFDERRFGPYIEFCEKLLAQEKDAYWLWENHVEDFANRPEYVYGYKHGYAYHGSNPFFMWNSTAIPSRYLSKVYFAGVRNFEVAARCGFEGFATVEEAIERAEAEIGKKASITLLHRPPQFIPRVSPN